MKAPVILVLISGLVVGCSSGSAGSSGELSGESVARDLGCPGCHTASDTDLAPTWNGLWGSEVELEDGTSLTADGSYVRRSIEQPHTDIVAGYGPTMPTFDMSEAEKQALVDYIESLG